MTASDTAAGVERPEHDRLKSRADVKPPIYRGVPYIRVALFVGLVLLYRVTRTDGLAQENIFNDWLLYSIVVVGFYFVFGISGQFAFSQAAMFGLGAYVSNWATDNPDHALLLGPIAAVIVCGAVAWLFSLVVQRTAHFYFAVGTLALTQIILLFLRNSIWFTKGAGGETLGVRPLSVFGSPVDTYFKTTVLFLGVLAALLCCGYLIERSPVRREAIANRDNEMVARTLGLPALRIRTSMFVLGSSVAGLAGSMWAHRSGSISVDSFSVSLGLAIFLMLILGGMSSIWGAVVGAWFYVYVRDYLQRSDAQMLGHSLSEYWGIIYGALLIVVMIVVPDGIIGVGARISRALRRDGRPLTPTAVRALLGFGVPKRHAPEIGTPFVTSAEEQPDIGEPVISATGVSVSFGGVRAVADVDLTLRRHEILGLIGPNGSGKSTLLNAMTGVVPATGSLVINGEAIAFGKPEAMRRAGLMRAFQTPQTYLNLTCVENVLLSSPDRSRTSIASATLLRPWMMRHERTRWNEAADALAAVGLIERSEDSASTLSYGQQRMLEIARAIAGRPEVLLLDEPSAGLNAVETDLLTAHIKRLRAKGMSIVVVDHKIDFISSLCDRVMVLELGRLVAIGDPRTIWDDEHVVNAYLGAVDED